MTGRMIVVPVSQVVRLALRWFVIGALTGAALFFIATMTRAPSGLPTSDPAQGRPGGHYIYV